MLKTAEISVKFSVKFKSEAWKTKNKIFASSPGISLIVQHVISIQEILPILQISNTTNILKLILDYWYLFVAFVVLFLLY